MSKKLYFFILSILIILPGLFFLIKFGLNLGIDFLGGTLIEVKIPQQINKEGLRQELSQVEISSIQDTGSSFILKLKTLDQQKIIEVENQIKQEFDNALVLRVESVGPIIGEETTRKAVLAIIIASLAIIIYLAISFSQVPKPANAFRFGIVAVLALLHDVLVLLGVFAILGFLLKVEVDVLFITAMLTVIGFSVHDTIVVFDRIRENLPKYLSKNFTDIANISIMQTLGRSLSTSLTVVFVLLALLLFGGESIRWFVVALLVGIISGTYSSIFNATALLVLWEEKLGH